MSLSMFVLMVVAYIVLMGIMAGVVDQHDLPAGLMILAILLWPAAMLIIVAAHIVSFLYSLGVYVDINAQYLFDKLDHLYDKMQGVGK